MTATAAPSRRRVRARIGGVVQGVGFRPYVYRLASSLELGGFIRNDERGVVVEAEGEPCRIEEFLARLPAEAPPLARVERMRAADVVPRSEREFTIAASATGARTDVPVSPDVATCPECLAEVFEPGDRRYRYPFTNCTNCGPRFTIVAGVPYDRARTTMAAFEMCDACRGEYEDPLDRRFHAQPNACPECGPSLRLLDQGGGDAAPAGLDALAATAAALREGLIVAIKGIGGYHLACRADEEGAVAALRSRKHREEKPFALMAADLAAAEALVELTDPERELLTGPERPIVVARRRPGAAVAASVAPGSPDLGLMLPYSPLHHLLLSDVGMALVMTSGNVSDEPIAFADADLERLAGIADLLCTHDRPIHTRTDDSVVRSLAPELRPEPLIVRRSRGWVPGGIPLPTATPRPILACGAELKSTFCLAEGERAWVSHHIGDLTNFETLTSFRDGIEHLERLFAVAPEVVVHDLHPDYLSTSYAREREGETAAVGVQHHHAHLAACLAEHGEEGPAVGAIFDGAGHGPDGTVWGGELLVGGTGGYERAGMLFPVPLPGGDAAAREPWRMALAWLAAALGEDEPEPTAQLAPLLDRRRWAPVAQIASAGLSSPPTSSVGRLFDAVAALCGLRAEVSHEGQAASELEAIAAPTPADPYPLPLLERAGAPLRLDARATIRAVVGDLDGGVDPALVSARFHRGLAAATATALGLLADRRGLDTVALGGGVFQNRLLLERTAALLADRGLRVLIPLRLPPNDGGISYGQAAIAARMLADRADRVEGAPGR